MKENKIKTTVTKATSAATRPYRQQESDSTTTTIVNSERDLKQANHGQRTERKRHKESFTSVLRENDDC